MWVFTVFQVNRLKKDSREISVIEEKVKEILLTSQMNNDFILH